MTPALWRLPAPLLLASTSPTRRLLLERAGLAVEMEASGVDERALEAQASPLASPDLARRLAAAKALVVSRRRPGRLVLGADQVLEVEGERLHKPASRDEARAQVARLSGRTHTLHAALALARDGALVGEAGDVARLALRDLNPDQVAHYLDLAGDAATASVGAYQVEGLGIHLLASTEGDHATILGLPLLPLLALLRGLGALAL